MKFVVFFRNLNLGRPPAPVRVQLEDAFRSAGATFAESFLTNGTLVFEAGTRAKAARILKRACAILKDSNGFQEPAFLRDLAYLEGLVQRAPFGTEDRTDAYEICVTFLDEKFVLPAEAPFDNRKKDVVGVEFTASEYFSVSYKLGASPGSPNVFIEKQFDRPATTRAWNTVCRLVRKHAQPGSTAMTSNASEVKDGQYCAVVGGTHAGKSGTVRDINTSKTGHVTITVVQDNGERFKTLARNVRVQDGGKA